MPTTYIDLMKKIRSRLVSSGVSLSVQERAKAFSERSYSYSISPARVLVEAERIKDAAGKGGYREGFGIEASFVSLLVPVAIVHMLEDFHWFIVCERIESNAFEVDYDEDWDFSEDAPLVTVTIVFNNEEDANRFRSALVDKAVPLAS